jgi:acetyl-CoA acetyltransferase
LFIGNKNRTREIRVGLKDFNPEQPGSVVLKDVLKMAKVERSEVEEFVMGNVLSPGHGQNACSL